MITPFIHGLHLARLARGEDEEEGDDSPGEAAHKLALVHTAVDAFFSNPDPGAQLEITPPRMSSFRSAFLRLKSLSRRSTSQHSNPEADQLRASVQSLELQVS